MGLSAKISKGLCRHLGHSTAFLTDVKRGVNKKVMKLTNFVKLCKVVKSHCW